MLPKDFRDQLRDHLLDLHWRQWASLGVSSHLNRSEGFILDLEALAVSTLSIGLLDRRLYEAALEWSKVNRSWLNLNRIKRIARLFIQSQGEDNSDSFSGEVLESYLIFLKTPSPRNADDPDNRNAGRSEHSDLIADFKARGIVVEPDVNLPWLQQLYLRSLFGVDARAEMFLYFLAGMKGNSNLISKEIYLEQKNLYRIIKQWVQAGILEESTGGDFILRDRNTWIKTLKVLKLPKYVSWARIYLFLDRLVLHLSAPALQEDTYLLSSFFRDISMEGRYLASVTSMDLPQEKSFPGKSYFEPFAAAILKMVEGLKI